MEQEAEEQSPTPAVQEEEDLPPPAKKKRGRKKGQKSKPKNSTNVKVEVEMNPLSYSSGGGGGGGSSSRRCTRSQAAPEWSVEETLVLVSEIATLDEVWLKSLSSYQKWKMISDSCMDKQVARSSNQCKRRWESLLSDYYKIKLWEPTSSYWCLGALERQHRHLPASFDHEVFGSIDALLNAQDAPLTDSEDIIAMQEEQEERGNITTDLEMEKMKQIMHNKNKTDDDDDDDPIYINIPEAEMFDANLGSGETGSKNIVSMVSEMAKLKETTEQVHPIESIDSVKKLHNTESKENTMNMQNKLQENVEQILVSNSMGNSSGMADKLQENMDNAVEMGNKLLEDEEQVQASKHMANELEMANKRHAIEDRDSSLEIANDPRKNAEEIKRTEAIVNKLQESTEQRHAIKRTGIELKMKLRENLEQGHAAIKGTKSFKTGNKLEEMHAVKSTVKALEMANKLQENAELIHAILRGDLPDHGNQGRALVDNAMETRRKADELIKAFGTLVGTLDRFTDLIKDGGCEGIGGMDSLALYKQFRDSANK